MRSFRFILALCAALTAARVAAETLVFRTGIRADLGLAFVTGDDLGTHVGGMPYVTRLTVEGGASGFARFATALEPGEALPVGLSLASDGTLAGTPPATLGISPHAFTVVARAPAGETEFVVRRRFTLAITGPQTTLAFGQTTGAIAAAGRSASAAVAPWSAAAAAGPGRSSGAWYFELLVARGGAPQVMAQLGLVRGGALPSDLAAGVDSLALVSVDATPDPTDAPRLAGLAGGCTVTSGGPNLAGFVGAVPVGVAVDLDAGALWVRVNGVWWGSDPGGAPLCQWSPGGEWRPAVALAAGATAEIVLTPSEIDGVPVGFGWW